MKMLQKAKKSLGQNFLVDQNIINKIIKIGNINKNKTIIEIGPGYGSLTKKILSMEPKKIITIEKDKKLSIFLKKKFKDSNNFRIINSDILKVIEEKKYGQNVIVFGNLPYNISTQILASLIMLKKWPPWYDVLILMFQKEVADRILASPRTKEFSRLTVLSNWRLEVRKHFNISKNCFFPKPKVESSVISFTPKKNYKHFKNSKSLEHITRIFFSNKRKMINKAYKNLFKDNFNIATQLNLNLKCRPSNLTCQNYYSLASFYEKLIY